LKTVKATVQTKLGENFKITESMKTKIEIINVAEEEIKMEATDLIDTIKNQNKIEAVTEDFHMRILKRFIKEISN